MMKQKIGTNAGLLLTLLATTMLLTACPQGGGDDNPMAAPYQEPNNNPGDGNPVPGSPGPFDYPIKNFRCEFEGQRGNKSIIPTVSDIMLGGNYGQTVVLRSKIFGFFDFGKLGVFTMKYEPASKTKSKADTIILTNDGLNKNMRITQSGFAGEGVKLEVAGDGLYVLITCIGTSQFKSPVTQTGKTNLVCKGKADLSTEGEEKIDISIPLKTITPDEEIMISKTVSVSLDNDATTIAYRGSLDPDYAPAVETVASLKSPTTFTISENEKGKHPSSGKINVTCSLQ